MLEDKKCQVSTFIHFVDEGGNILDEIIEELKNPDRQNDKMEIDNPADAFPMGVGKSSKMKPNFGGKILTEEEKEAKAEKEKEREEKKLKKKRFIQSIFFAWMI